MTGLGRRCWIGMVVACLWGLSVVPAHAAIERDFTSRFSTNTNGDIYIVGNMNMSCSTTIDPGRSNCAAARAGGNRANNQHFMEMVDQDTSATFNSSAAEINVPAGAEVVFAGLYWGSRTTAGSGGAAAPNAALRNQILFRAGTGAYNTVTATQLDDLGSTYSAFADVTSFVQSQGVGTTEYWGANIQAGTGRDRYAGWSLVMVIADPNDILRNLTVFDGYASVTGSSPVSATVSGFRTPPAGVFSASVGAVAFEGDLRYTGDRFRVNGTDVSNAQNPATNFFNSSISRKGVRLSDREPDYINTLGFDIDVVDVSTGPAGLIDNGDTSADLTFVSTGDVYYSNVLTFAVEIFQPVLTDNFQKNLVQVNGAPFAGGDVLPGDELVYEVIFENTGNDPATQVELTDPIPADTTFVSGSLEIIQDDADTVAGGDNVGVKTDAVDGDEGEFTGGAVVVRIGAGADGTSGGQVNSGDTAVVRYRLMVSPSISPVPATLTNTITVNYNGFTTGDPFTGDTSESVTVAVPPEPEIGVAKQVTAGPTDNLDGTHTLSYTVVVENSGAPNAPVMNDLTSVSISEDLQATFGAATFVIDSVVVSSDSGTLVAAPGFTGSGAGVELLDPSSSLPEGESGQVVLTLTVTPGSNPGPYQNQVSASGTNSFGATTDDDSNDSATPDANGNGDPTDDSTPTPVLFNSPPIANDDIDAADFADPPITINAFANDTDPDIANGDAIALVSVDNTNPPEFGTLVNNGDGTFDYTAPVVAPPGFTGLYEFTYTITDNAGQTSTATVSITVPPAQADLGVLKAIDQDPVEVGDTVVFTLTAQNFGALTGGQPAVAQVTDVLPSGYTYVSSVAQQGSYDPASGLWEVGTLASGDATNPVEVTLEITATVNANGDYTNNASITADNAADLFAANNTATVTPVILVPSVDVTKAVSVGPTSNGDGSFSLSYDIVVQNTGDTDLSGVQVLEDLSVVFADASDVSVSSVTSTDFATNTPGFDGVADTALLTASAANALTVGSTGTITLSLVVTPGADLGPYTNEVAASADSPIGSVVEATGTAADVTFVESPSLTTTKTIDSGPVNNNDGTYTLIYQIDVANTGDVPLSNVQLVDDLDANFPAPATFAMLSLVPTNLSPSPIFDGVANDNLLDGSDTLDPGESGSVLIELTVTPGSALGPYTNSVQGSGDSPSGATAMQTGTAPSVTFTEAPAITTTKALAAPGAINNNDGTYTVTYDITVTNSGDGPLNNVQVVDVLTDTFPAPAVVSAVQDPVSSDFTVNTAFTGAGDNNLLTGSDTLDSGDSGTVSITFTVDPNIGGGGSLGPFTNLATSSGDSPSGASVNNPGSAPALTFTEAPDIGSSKTIVSGPTNNGDGTYAIGYAINVVNTGNVNLNQVSVEDDLATLFAAPASFTIAPASISVISDSNTLLADTAFTGSAPNTELLLNTSTLPVNESGTITFTVTVRPRTSLGPYANTVSVGAVSPALVPVNDTATAAPVTFTEDPEIGGTKSVSSAITNNNDGTYDLDFTVLIENSGDVLLDNVQAVDDLSAAFPGATVQVLNIQSTDFTVNTGYDGVGNNNLLATVPPATLVAGASGTVVITVRVTPGTTLGPYENTATASGDSPGGSTVDAPSMTAPIVFPEAPGITVVKTTTATNPLTAEPNDTVVYNYVVTNSGDVPLTGITLVDDIDGAVTLSATSLLPGEQATGTINHTLTQLEIDAGVLTNVATANGTSSGGESVEATDDVTLTLTPDPSLSVEKMTTSPLTITPMANDTVVYNYTVTNTGNVTIDAITLTDNIDGVVAVTPTTLAAGEMATGTITHTITQLEINAGSLTNVATASGTDPDDGVVDSDPNDPDATVTIVFSQTIMLEVDKTTTAVSPLLADENDTIVYNYVVTNTGNVTVDSIALTDDVDGAVTITPTTLQPGETATGTITHTLTQGEINAGSLTNIATAQGQDPNSNQVNSDPMDPDATVTVDFTAAPQLSVAKTTTATSPLVADENDTITYNYVVTNDGNVTIDSIALNDDIDGAVTLSVTSLDPGETATGTITHSITQLELDAGSLTNVATVSGQDPDDNAVDSDPNDPNATVTVDFAQQPLLTVDKSTTAISPLVAMENDVITYNYVVTNDGNVTVDTITLTDSVDGAVTLSVTSLAPGETATGTISHTISQAELNAGSLTNVATASGLDPADNTVDSDPADPDATVTVNFAQQPVLEVEKSTTAADPLVAQANDIVVYNYVVTNAGNVTVTGITLNDDIDGAVTLSATDLAPGETATGSINHTVTQLEIDAGSLTNVAQATGQDPGSNSVSSDLNDPDATVTVNFAQQPALTVDKSTTAGDPLTASADDTVNYNYVVTNSGNVTLTGITLDDSIDGAVTLSATTLLPGETATGTITHTITQVELDAGSLTNVATASGTDPDNNLIDSDPADPDATVTVNFAQTPSLSVQKTTTASDPLVAAANDIVTYNYVVTNTGNVTVTGVTLNDDIDGVVTLSNTTLAPGDTATGTVAHAVTQNELDAGSLTNVATAAGNDPGDNAVNSDPADPNATVTVNFAQTPALTVAKTSNASDPLVAVAGDIIVYSYVVTNSGNVTVDNIVLDDSIDGAVTLSVTRLTPGETASGTINHTVTQAEIDAGSLTNVATVNGTDPDNNPVVSDAADPNASVTVNFAQNGQLGVAKSISAEPVNNLDGTYSLSYTLRVENSGNVTLQSLQLVDDLAATFSGVTFSVQSVSGDFSANPAFDGDGVTALLTGGDTLSVGASGTMTVEVTVTPAGSLGPFANEAIAQAVSADGSSVSDDSVDGDTPDADGDGDPTNDASTTDVTFVENPVLGVAKASSESVPNFDGTFTLTTTLLLQNSGDVPLQNVQLTDDLSTNLAPATVVSVDGLAISGALSAVNSGFDGVTSTTLLSGTQSLNVGEQAQVTFELTFNPNGSLGPFSNLATGSASTPGNPDGTSPNVSDVSTNGGDPDPDSAGNMPGDNLAPGDNAEPTPVTFVPGADGTIDITDRSAPGDVLQITVNDVDLNTDPGAIDTVTVTVTNDLTGEAEQLVATETGPNTGVFTVALPTQFGQAAGTNDDGILNTQDSDTVSASYIDTLTANGGVETRTDTGEVSGLANVSGNVWFDENIDDAFDGAESPLTDWVVEIVQDGVVVASTRAASDGSYAFTELPPGSSYTIQVRNPDNGAVFDAIEGITLQPLDNLVEQNFPIDPSGVVYDSVTRLDVPGAVVALVDGSGAPVPADCLLPDQQNQTTGTNGFYRFDVVPDAAPACTGENTYTLVVTVPEGYRDGVSTFIPPQSGVFDPTGLGDPVAIAPQTGAPQNGESTTYYLSFSLAANDPNVIQNHVPIDPLDVDDASVRVTKRADSPTTTIGGLVRYTITAENVSSTTLNGLTLRDTPPAGFNYVDGSARLNGAAAGFNVQRAGREVNFTNLVLSAGDSLSLSYVARVGAGVTRGSYTNSVTPLLGESIVGNTAREVVELAADPDFEQTTIFGKVWHDRDEDGWQDSANATDLFVQGGFDANAYVANSTTVDYGDGPQPVADASSPLLRGLALGSLSGRVNQADPIAEHRIVIRQTLRQDALNDDLRVLTGEGTRVNVNRLGDVSVQHVSDKARGLTAQDIRVRRTIRQVGDNYELAVILTNHGIHEEGLPGVRLATVTGLLIETDGYGRYHLAGVDVERFERGRNFYLKVDSATLPKGAQFTTENPRVKRITQGLMNRFNFGVKLPHVEQTGSRIEVELGTVFFAKESAQVHPNYQSMLSQIAEQLVQNNGGLLTIEGHAGTCTTGEQAVKEFVFSPRFAPLSADLSESDKARLDTIAADWKGIGDLVIDIVGHTSDRLIRARSRHIFADNYALSRARADAVATYLLNGAGLSSEHVSTDGRGPDEPVASNQTADGRALNRRVEIRFQGESEIPGVCARSYDARALAEQRAQSVLNALKELLPEEIMDAVDVQIKSIEDTAESETSLRVSPLERYEGSRKSGPSGESVMKRLARRSLVGLVALLGTTAHASEMSSDCDIRDCRTDDGVVVRIINHGDLKSAPTGPNGETQESNRKAVVSGSFMQHLPQGGVIWATEDPAVLQPSLAVVAPSRVPLVARAISEPVVFVAYTNYPDFIDEFELSIYAADDLDRVNPIHVIRTPALGSVTELTWQGGSTTRFQRDDELSFVLRAYNDSGHFDETQAKPLLLVDKADFATRLTGRMEQTDQSDESLLSQPSALSAYGSNDLALQNIPIHGSRVRISGQDVGSGTQVTINGQPVPVDVQEKFVAEFLVPVGQHVFSVGLDRGQDRSYVHELNVDVSGKYMFLAALADITASQNDIAGSLEPLSADERFDESVFVEGRLAFYLKGKVKGKYLVTAQMDSEEEQLSELFDNLLDKNPNAIFRRLDPDRYYPVYGDESTTLADTNSIGKMYLRVDWDKSQLLWGNYNTGITGNEFTQYSRSLYGAKVDYNSVATTEQGQHKTQLKAFLAEGQTALGHDEFLGTGGSLYYLRETDILPGSEKARIEIRDRDSGRVLENIALERDADYEVDEIQGRIILTRPLTQISRQRLTSIIRDEPLDGNDVLLIIDYEYLPRNFDANHLTTGARGKKWIGEHVAIGGTYVDEGRGGDDYSLYGVDVTLQAGVGTYLKVESARSEASQTNRHYSTDGGLNFASLEQIDPATGRALGAQRQGDAVGVEARANLKELGWTGNNWGTGVWWRRTDDNYSVARRDLGVDTKEYGAEIIGDVNERVNIALRASIVEQENRLEEEIYSALANIDVGRNGRVTAELRQVNEKRGNDAEFASGTLGALQYAHLLESNLELYATLQGTLANDDGRYDNNDLLTFGARKRVSNFANLNAEYSTGHRGDASSVGLDYQVNDNHRLYGTYTLSTDRTDSDLNSQQVTFGNRSRLTNQLSVFSENQFTDLDEFSGVSHVFGLDFAPAPGWTTGISVQQGELEGNNGLVDRDAMTVTGGYQNATLRWNSKVEYRNDNGLSDNRRQWLTTNRFDVRASESLKFLGKLNYSETVDDISAVDDARFVEGSVGFAYRPIDNDRLNMLGKYTYLYDVLSNGQNDSRTDQRSEIFSLEGLYDVGHRWQMGAKLARRTGELRLERGQGPWIDSTVNFAALRGRYHLIKRWDGLIEYRWLEVEQDDSVRSGWLFGVDRHIGDHMKLGVGYNFTDFSDNLAITDYENRGWFVNLVGKY